jgi:methyl-accepting chemotaxis protein
MPHLRFTVGRKLALAFLPVVALTLVALVAALRGTDALHDSTTTVGERVVPAVRLLGDATTEIRQFRVAQLERTLADTPADQRDLDGELRDTATTVDSILARLRRYAATPAEAAALDRTRADWLRYRRTSGAFTAAAATGGTTAAYAVLDGKADGIYDQLKADVAASSRLTTRRSAQAVATSEDDATSTRRTLLLTLIASLLVAVGAAAVVARSIRRSVAVVLRSLRSLRDHCAAGLDGGLRAFAAGDLTHGVEAVTPPIPDPGSDEIGDVARATNAIRDTFVTMVESYNASRGALADLVGEMAGTAGAVSAASRQMAATSDEAGRAVTEIATAVAEAAAGSERQVATIGDARRLADEVVAVTGRSAQDAASTAQAAEEARLLAGQGAEAVSGATAAMSSVRDASAGASEAIEALGRKSAEIGGIVDTITGIAEQTNLLALNAAIEAARAGEQGRGFAVVAEEVRKLAEESQAAAGSISALIGEIQGETSRAITVVQEGARRTREGSEVVDGAREAFERIGGSVEDVTARVGAIAAAVEQIAAAARAMGERMAEVAAVAEQSSASGEQVSASTQQTSASTQEIAASAHELARTASDLDALVARFTLGDVAARAASA